MSGRLRTFAALLALGLALAPESGHGQRPRADRPAYSTGEVWQRDDGTYRLTTIDRDLYVFTAAPDREVRLTRDLGIARVRRGDDVIEFFPAPRVAWPLDVGKWGRESSDVYFPGLTARAGALITWRVDGYEDVTVGGATLKAYRLTFVLEPDPTAFGTAGSGGTMMENDTTRALRWGFTLWYAPSAQRLVKGASDKPALVFEVAQATVPPAVATVETPRAPPPQPAAPRPTPPPPTVVPAPPPPPVVPPVAAAPAPVPPAGTSSSIRVQLSSPADQARVHDPHMPLAGLVHGARGITRVVVTLNGVEVVRQDEREARPAVSIAAPLTLREGPNLLVVAATQADGTIHHEVRTVHYDRPVPLTLAFRYPDNGARLTEESTVVTAIADSGRGVARVAVSLNGAEVFRQDAAAPARSLVVTAPVTLRDGANVIVLSATDPGGAVVQEVRTVFLDRGKVASAPPPPPPAPTVRDTWAVIIGVGKYDSRAIPPLRYSVPDAEAVYRTLIETGGLRKERVILLADTAERKPTLRNIKWALGTFLARQARKDDTVLIFFAGHGAPEVDPRGIERDGLAKYLIPADADADDLFSTALPMDDIQTIFARIEAERVVMFLDACYSGAAGGRTFASQKTRASHLDDIFLERLTRSKGRAIITASRPAEVAIELSELGHGVFTYYLVRGLSGAADYDRDGIVSVQELYQYLEHEVTRKSRASGGNQHPVMKGELEGPLPLVKFGRR
jgi:hypothetical protein